MLKDKLNKIAEELYNKGAENQNLYDNMGCDVSQAVNKILELIRKEILESMPPRKTHTNVKFGYLYETEYDRRYNRVLLNIRMKLEKLLY